VKHSPKRSQAVDLDAAARFGVLLNLALVGGLEPDLVRILGVTPRTLGRWAVGESCFGYYRLQVDAVPPLAKLVGTDILGLVQWLWYGIEFPFVDGASVQLAAWASIMDGGVAS